MRPLSRRNGQSKVSNFLHKWFEEDTQPQRECMSDRVSPCYSKFRSIRMWSLSPLLRRQTLYYCSKCCSYFGTFENVVVRCSLLWFVSCYHYQCNYYSTVTAFLTVCILTKISFHFENFRNTSDSEPSAKKRKTTTAVAVADQSGQNSKILIDSMSDNIMNMDEVTITLVLLCPCSFK